MLKAWDAPCGSVRTARPAAKPATPGGATQQANGREPPTLASRAESGRLLVGESRRWRLGHDADESWWGFNGLFSGYLVSLAALACEATVADPDRPLRSITMQFLRPAPAGRLLIEVTTEQPGRSVWFLPGPITAEGKLCALFLVVAATDQDGQEFTNRTMPEVPAFEESSDNAAPRIFALPVFDHFEEREIHRDGSSVLVWVRPNYDTEIDLPLLLMVCDVVPPVAIGRVSDPHAAGTITLTANLRSPLPVPASAGAPVRRCWWSCTPRHRPEVTWTRRPSPGPRTGNSSQRATRPASCAEPKRDSSATENAQHEILDARLDGEPIALPEPLEIAAMHDVLGPIPVEEHGETRGPEHAGPKTGGIDRPEPGVGHEQHPVRDECADEIATVAIIGKW